MTTYRVTFRHGINVRNQPQIAPNNIIGSIMFGDTFEVEPDIQRVSADGWVWRKLVAPQVLWVAEINQISGERLIEPVLLPRDHPTPSPLPPEDDIPTSPPDPVITQTYRVVGGFVNVRNQPSLNGQRVRMVRSGDRLEILSEPKVVGADGWVWRRIAVVAEEWVAELNQNTGDVLLRLEGEQLPVVGRVQTDGTRFLLDGRPFRFIGVNCREFAYYGLPVLPFANWSHQDDQIRGATSMLMRVVRFYAPHHTVGTDEVIPLVRQALDKLYAAGMLAIVALNDSIGQSGYYVSGDRPFHTEVLDHVNKHAYFINEGYRQHYLPFVQRLVSSFRDHPAIFAWELGNEYAIHPQPATEQDGNAFIRFAHNVSRAIRELDTNHLITTGLINTGQVAPAGADPRQFTALLYDTPTIDFGTVHFYQEFNNPNAAFAMEEQRCIIDAETLQQLGKPIVVEEFGATAGNHNRVDFTSRKLSEWFGRGAAGFMQWGLSATNMDVGIGDNLHGMDPFSQNNAAFYAAMQTLYRQWGQQLQQG
ncbi:MAG: cellulase family glycosylhydrolase [Pseudomonadales bacterium]|nr:cellulase family glycosylhydrolase [Pseudomonadales bacterium]